MKNLRRLMLSMGLSVKTASDLMELAHGHLAELSAKACEVEMYVAAHPEVERPASYAAVTLKNFAAEMQARQAGVRRTVGKSAAAPLADSPTAEENHRHTMELWGDE